MNTTAKTVVYFVTGFSLAALAIILPFTFPLDSLVKGLLFVFAGALFAKLVLSGFYIDVGDGTPERGRLYYICNASIKLLSFSIIGWLLNTNDYNVVSAVIGGIAQAFILTSGLRDIFSACVTKKPKKRSKTSSKKSVPDKLDYQEQYYSLKHEYVHLRAAYEKLWLQINLPNNEVIAEKLESNGAIANEETIAEQINSYLQGKDR